MSDLRMLLIEDETLTRMMAEKMLKKYFSNVVSAADGQEGIDKFNSGSYDIIITDLQMPKLSGSDMIKKIRQTNDEIPIYVITAYDSATYNEVKDMIQGVFEKPLDFSAIVETVTRAAC